jgi:hypothetical protein
MDHTPNGPPVSPERLAMAGRLRFTQSLIFTSPVLINNLFYPVKVFLPPMASANSVSG